MAEEYWVWQGPLWRRVLHRWLGHGTAGYGQGVLRTGKKTYNTFTCKCGESVRQPFTGFHYWRKRKWWEFRLRAVWGEGTIDLKYPEIEIDSEPDADGVVFGRGKSRFYKEGRPVDTDPPEHLGVQA